MIVKQESIEPSTDQASDYKHGQGQITTSMEAFHSIFSKKSPFDEAQETPSVSDMIKDFIVREFANL